MNKKFLVGAMCATVCALAMNGQVKNGSLWTDGMVFYKAEVKTDGKVLMDGGTLHEGGFSFVMKKAGGSSYTVHPSDPQWEYIALGSQCKNGFRVENEQVAGVNVLSCYNPGGEQVAMLQQFDGGLEELMVKERQLVVAGDYVDTMSGKKWTFTADGKCGTGNGRLSPYTVMKSFEIPSDMIRQADGSFIRLEYTADGLNVRPVKVIESEGDEIDACEVGDVVTSLKRVPGATGKWEFTSQRLVSSAILCSYDSETLRLMRNEIYARHGWQFSTPSLQSYFEAQPWYVNKGDNSQVVLTDLEKKNAQTIRMVEQFPEE